MERITTILKTLTSRLLLPAGWWGGIGCRVAFFMSLALLLVAVLVGIFFFWEGKRAVDAEIRSRQLYVARHMAALIADDVITENRYEIYRKLASAFLPQGDRQHDEDLIYLMAYNRRGELIIGSTQAAVVTAADASTRYKTPQGALLSVETALRREVLTLSGPFFERNEKGFSDLILPISVEGERTGFIRIGISGHLHAEKFSRLAKKGVFALFAIFALGLAFSEIIAASITRRLSRLSAAVEALSSQNWKVSVPVRGKDEISTLGHAFNQMALTLKQREASLSRGNRDLFILHTAGLDLMESLDIDTLLLKIGGRAEDLVRADTIALSAVDAADRTLKYIGVFGNKARAIRDLDMALEAGGIFNWIVSYGTPLLVQDAPSDFRLDKNLMEALGIRCLMTVPLWSSNTMTGLLTAVNKKGGACFDKHDLRLFTVFSNLIGAALQNANLYTDLKNSMEERKHAQEQLVLSAKMAAIGELATNVAHEINNPLTSVLGYTSHLLKTLDLPESPKRMLAMMEQETLRVRKIIRSLLDFARARPTHMWPADLLQPLRETVAFVSGVAASSSVHIREDYDGTPLIVNMDSNQMKQVFINIVNNSFQAMPQGGSLTIRAAADNRRNAVVEFQDTGVGIAKEDVAKIFAPFFSTKTEGNGTGLGLSISERIVQNHGGRIEVESVPGAGSVFKVIVPLYQETPSAADRGSEKREYV